MDMYISTLEITPGYAMQQMLGYVTGYALKVSELLTYDTAVILSPNS